MAVADPGRRDRRREEGAERRRRRETRPLRVMSERTRLRLAPRGQSGHTAPAGGRAGAMVIALLAAWDMLATAGILVLTGASGGGAGGVLTDVAAVLATPIGLSVAGGYRPASWLREHPIEMLGGLAVTAAAVAWGAVMVAAAAGARLHLGALSGAWVALPVAWYAGRRMATRAWRRRRPERLLVVGGGEVAERVLSLARRTGASVLGRLDDGPAERHGGVPVLGAIEELPQVLQEHDVDRVVIAFSSRRDYDTLEVLRGCTGFHGTVDIVPRFFDFLGPTATMYSTDGLPFLSIPGRRATRGRAVVKRTFDLVGATGLLLALSPLLALIALAIVLDSGRPVLFRQSRIGQHGRRFMIFKFRTLAPSEGPRPNVGALELTPAAIALHVEQAKQEAVSRATRVGAFLRRTSLDELPQLVNVVLGHMSLVGPRPLSSIEDASLEGWELLRREVRPGITGLWQVSGRSDVSWAERVSLDYRQVRHWSLYSDMKVLSDTVGAVIRQRGAE